MKITVVDYGLGNIYSVTKAFEFCGADVELSDVPKDIANADSLVLPGVGSFGAGMQLLSNNGIAEAILEFAATNRPFMGICLGMQMLLDSSEEFGEHKGLGLIPGRVVAIPPMDADGVLHKIPHIGWNTLHVPSHGCGWEDSILSGIEPGSPVYFVHSFTADPENERHRLADCKYGGTTISAAIRRDNLYGFQFHPEKSGPVGLQILKQFIAL